MKTDENEQNRFTLLQQNEDQFKTTIDITLFLQCILRVFPYQIFHQAFLSVLKR